jgi:hypothetical protein
MQPALTASTLEFREAVRKVAREQGLSIYDSYTNRISGSSDALHRTVGFDIGGATPETAALSELELSNKNLAAWTRCCDSSSTRHSWSSRDQWRTYIRGTCVLA